MRKHISQLCQLCLCLCNGRSWFVRWWSKGQLYLELNAIVVFYRLGYFCRSFSFLEPFFFPNVGIRQPRQNMNIFPSDSHKPKSLPGNIFRWVQIQNFFLMLNVRNPPNFDNLGDDQKTGISTDLRPAFFHEFWKKWVGMSTLWSRNQDCWSLLFTKTSLQYFTFVYLSSFGVFLVSGRNLD